MRMQELVRLSSLLREVDRPLRPPTGRLIRMSPWTVTLQISLRRLCIATPSNQYEVVLREKLMPYSSDLLSLVWVILPVYLA